MTEKEKEMAREAGRICRNLQAENQRLREQLKGDPERDRQDAEAFAIVRRHRGAQPQSQAYNVRPVFDYDNPVELENGGLVLLDDAEDLKAFDRKIRKSLMFLGALTIGAGIWLARSFNWVDGTTAIAVTVILAVATSILRVR